MRAPAVAGGGHPFKKGERVLFLSVLLWALLLVVIVPFARAETAPESPSPVPGFDPGVPAAFLVDTGTGQVLYEKSADEKVSPASISKVMVLLLAMEAIEEGRAHLDDQVQISERAASMGGSQLYLAAGSSYTLQELLEMLAIASANDATVAITEYLAGSEAVFVAAMNRRAKELGMKDTVFRDASGLPLANGEENVSTARDIARMSLELVRRFPKVLEWTSIWTKQFRPDLPVAVNTNRLIRRYPGADGLKTGHTEKAGYSVVATARRDDRRLLAVVLRAGSDQERLQATTSLLDYGFNGFRQVLAVPAGKTVGRVRVAGGSPAQVEAAAPADIRVLLPRIASTRGVEEKLLPRQDLRAPLKKGDRVGELVLFYDGSEIGRHPVVAATDVKRAGLLARLWQWLRDLIAGLFRG
ncbi:MAG TPA: D-alanyl-D-alanine carboxypeptidase [Firmicutes bacterium]|nr:D-alanyl-D-alanine carboxypeptidase [Bacillota bacterium]